MYNEIPIRGNDGVINFAQIAARIAGQKAIVVQKSNLEAVAL